MKEECKGCDYEKPCKQFEYHGYSPETGFCIKNVVSKELLKKLEYSPKSISLRIMKNFGPSGETL